MRWAQGSTLWSSSALLCASHAHLGWRFPPSGRGASWDKEEGQGLMSLGELGLSGEDKHCCRKGLQQLEGALLPVARKFFLARSGGPEHARHSPASGLAVQKGCGV